MKAYFSLSRWWALVALGFCFLLVSRLAAEESDDEPTPAAATQDNTDADDAAADESPAAEADSGAATPAATKAEDSDDDAKPADSTSNENKPGDPPTGGTTAEAENSSGTEEPVAPATSEPVRIERPLRAGLRKAADAVKADVDPEVKPAAAPAELPTVAKSEADDEAADSSSPLASQPTPIEKGPGLQPAETKLTTEAASFKGIQPGTSTAAELAESWGAPKEIRKQKGRRIQVYQIDIFPRVTVTLSEGLVTSVVVNLDKPMGAEELARQLSIDDISSVQVTDDKGQLLGESFPERGVMFGYGPKSDPPRVRQVVLEPIDAAPFLLRAETHLRTHYARCLADANAALTIDPKSAQAQGLRARVFLRAGDLAQALGAAQTAAELEPQEAEWHLLAAKVLTEAGDFAAAQHKIQGVLDSKDASTLTKAKAHSLLGDCMVLSLHGDEDAMKHHLQAIKLAEPLLTSSRLTVRRGAKEVMLDAHLGAAVDVGWGHWQQKNPSIAKWVERATNFAKDLVEHEQAEDDVLQRVDRKALMAMAGVAEPPDASKWIGTYLKRSAQMIEQTSDAARQAQLEWELGLALSDAATIEQARGHFDKCSEYGRLALKHMEEGKQASLQLANHDYLLGQVLYKLGATAALGDHNHRRAIEWYGRAVPLLETPVPPSRLTDPGRSGETFVSIAVSYWELGRREEALRLTRQGIKLMETAIDDGLMSKSALAVPYANLASMHTELGDKQLAAEFTELSAKCQATKR